ncbi:MAG: DUF302 domain-containing protein [Deltaproteobacteria bacterium]|nr:DUF302 domain-containing protein [Deltaproteobacteria bacterium]
MHELPYGFGRLLGETDFETACATTIRALEEQQFAVVAQIDLQKTLEAKLELEFRRYIILAVCDPALAERALEVDPHIGLLLLWNVVVQEGAGSGLYVAVETSQPLFQLTHHPRLKFIAVETERRLRLAVDAMS